MNESLRRKIALVLPFVIAGAFFLTSLQHLGQFLTADEHYWIEDRMPQYFDAWRDRRLEKTYINDKPGVTVALVSGIRYAFHPGFTPFCTRTDDKIETCDPVRTERELFWFRLPLLIVNTFLLLYIFWIIRRLAGGPVALWSMAFMAFTPKLIGMTRIINPDALLWSFSAAALFTFLALLKDGKRRYLFLSGILLGFAVLSKYVASILLPLFFAAGILSLWFRPEYAADRKAFLAAYRKRLLFFFGTLLTAIAVIEVFLPAAAFKPAKLLALLSGGSHDHLVLILFALLALFFADARLVGGRILFFLFSLGRRIRLGIAFRFILPWVLFLLFAALVVGRSGLFDWPLFDRVPFDAKDLTTGHVTMGFLPNIFESYLLEASPLFFSLPTVAAILFLFLLLVLPFARPGKEEWRFEAYLLLFLFPLYFSALIYLDTLASSRYVIMLFPVAAFLSALAITVILQTVSGYFAGKPHFAVQLRVFAGATVVVSLLCSAVPSVPYSFTYANAFLPKERAIADLWGIGGYQAAQYLNKLPGAEKLLVWSDYGGFCEFFVGRCIERQYNSVVGQPIDYAVMTRRGKIVYNPEHIKWMKPNRFYMKPAYDDLHPEWLLEAGGRPANYVKVAPVRATTYEAAKAAGLAE